MDKAALAEDNSELNGQRRSPTSAASCFGRVPGTAWQISRFQKYAKRSPAETALVAGTACQFSRFQKYAKRSPDPFQTVFGNSGLDSFLQFGYFSKDLFANGDVVFACAGMFFQDNRDAQTNLHEA